MLSPDNELVCDVKHKIQSRGVYVCADKACLTKALKKKCFSRFLKKDDVEQSLEILAKNTASGYKHYVYSLLNLASKSGKLALGNTSVFYMADKNKAKLLILASDAGNSIESKALHLSEKKEINIIVLDKKTEIADKLSIDEKSIMAVCADGFASSILKGWRVYSDVIVW